VLAHAHQVERRWLQQPVALEAVHDEMQAQCGRLQRHRQGQLGALGRHFHHLLRQPQVVIAHTQVAFAHSGHLSVVLHLQ
jgi:hypothetical protein